MWIFWKNYTTFGSYLGGLGGRAWGCQPRHKWVWGGYVTLFWKMLNQKALIKRFSFVVYIIMWANTYQKIYVSLRVCFSRVRSSC